MGARELHPLEEPQAGVAPLQADIWLEVHVVAPTPETHASLEAHRVTLPDYDGGVAWVVVGREDVAPSNVPDLSIVLCSRTVDLPAATAIADRLARRGDTTILLVGKNVDASSAEVRGALVVRAPGADPIANLVLLAHTVLAPAAALGWACVDWADVLTILDEGREAILMGASGTTRLDAMENLLATLAEETDANWRGACATMASPLGVRITEYGAFNRAIAARMRSDAFQLLAVPDRPVSREEVTLLVMTKPSRRLEAKRGQAPGS